jgi:hypothetical protein
MGVEGPPVKSKDIERVGRVYDLISRKLQNAS